MEKFNLINADCLDYLKHIPSNSVTLVLTDPPYGTTTCKWDNVIPFEEMWSELKRIVKPNGAILLFGCEPFSSLLRLSNLEMYKYDWIWEKSQGVNFAQCNHMPMSIFEKIHVFGNFGMSKNAKIQPIYNPQGIIEINKHKTAKTNSEHRQSENNKEHIQKFSNYPKSILKFSSEKGLHPTQKPVDLLRYLIKTYSNENDLVLDFTMGSGSTGVACLKENRIFLGIEKDESYFNIAKDRIYNSCEISKLEQQLVDTGMDWLINDNK